MSLKETQQVKPSNYGSLQEGEVKAAAGSL